MKRLLPSFLAALLTATSVICSMGCSGDDDEGEYVSGFDGIVTTNNATDVTCSSATITGTIDQELLSNTSVVLFGVSYGEDANANDALKTANAINQASFTIILSGLSSETTYYYKAFLKDNNGNYIYGSTRKFTTEKVEVSSSNGKVVDLGLPSGTKWADRNVGADSPEDYGGYYAWGETSEKDNYSSSTSVTCGKSNSELQEAGIIDNDGNLTAKYDAATANWGNGWHTPTLTQIKELLENCEWTCSSKNGVNGYFVTGSNGNSIFLPAAGRRGGASLYEAGNSGFYRSTAAYESHPNSNSYSMCFKIVIQGYYGWGLNGNRDDGFSVRPVSED